MALSPWKRLRQLMLRRRPNEQLQAGVADNRDKSGDVIDTPDVAFDNSIAGNSATLDPKPVAAPADRLLHAGDLEPPEAVETAAELKSVIMPLPGGEPVAADEVPPASPSIQQLNDGLGKKTRKARRKPTKADPPVQAEQDRLRTLDKARSPLSDVEVLDEEIRQLRKQLSAKLRIQNIQLKQMLKRFD